MVTWNTRSLTFERFEYVKNLKYDVISLTELWRTQNNYQTSRTNFTVSESIKVKIPDTDKFTIRYPDDKAAGVGILLSDAAEEKLESFGAEGERICCKLM